MAKVIGFQLGESNSALRMPYALARLDCGHVAGVVLRPRRGACVKCGTERDMPEAGIVECCGRSSFKMVGPYPNPHNEADRLTKVGDEIDCSECQKEAAQLAWLKSLDPSTVHHTRERWGGVHLYRLDHTSPSNFMLIGSVAPTPAVAAILRSWGGGKTPLSPTEPA